MIRPLRDRHRWLMTVLAVGVPVGFLTALAARSPEPRAHELPADLWEREESFATTTWEREDLWGEFSIRTTLSYNDAGPHVILEPLEDLRRPEVLVYWAQTIEDALPEDARLLGRLAGTARHVFALPRGTTELGGRLILYSLGHQEVLASVHISNEG